ncbi:hypothetical protein FH972_022371 [Carpinus fangiana]|uniref:Autophagy-related protein n=3 Tax=Eukaryota TaxID=2759 RepID=A0A5N6KUA5_9ROSI|nr:hypothetical protein FH972_022371 [Carpinus fangiana]
MRSKFKDEHPFEKRKAEAERIRQKYSDRIPVICEKVEKSDIATIDKKKYLVPADLTVGQFVYVIRKRIKLSPEKAIFIFVDEVLPPTAALMSSIYEEHKDEDGFLYITWRWTRFGVLFPAFWASFFPYRNWLAQMLSRTADKQRKTSMMVEARIRRRWRLRSASQNARMLSNLPEFRDQEQGVCGPFGQDLGRVAHSLCAMKQMTQSPQQIRPLSSHDPAKMADSPQVGRRRSRSLSSASNPILSNQNQATSVPGHKRPPKSRLPLATTIKSDSVRSRPVSYDISSVNVKSITKEIEEKGELSTKEQLDRAQVLAESLQRLLDKEKEDARRQILSLKEKIDSMALEIEDSVGKIAELHERLAASAAEDLAKKHVDKDQGKDLNIKLSSEEAEKYKGEVWQKKQHIERMESEMENCYQQLANANKDSGAWKDKVIAANKTIKDLVELITHRGNVNQERNIEVYDPRPPRYDPDIPGGVPPSEYRYTLFDHPDDIHREQIVTLLLMMARVALNWTRDFSKAEQRAHEAFQFAKRSPVNPWLLSRCQYWLGRAHFKLRSYTEAAAAFEAARPYLDVYAESKDIDYWMQRTYRMTGGTELTSRFQGENLAALDESLFASVSSRASEFESDRGAWSSNEDRSASSSLESSSTDIRHPEASREAAQVRAWEAFGVHPIGWSAAAAMTDLQDYDHEPLEDGLLASEVDVAADLRPESEPDVSLQATLVDTEDVQRKDHQSVSSDTYDLLSETASDSTRLSSPGTAERNKHLAEEGGMFSTAVDPELPLDKHARLTRQPFALLPRNFPSARTLLEADLLQPWDPSENENEAFPATVMLSRLGLSNAYSLDHPASPHSTDTSASTSNRSSHRSGQSSASRRDPPNSPVARLTPFSARLANVPPDTDRRRDLASSRKLSDVPEEALSAREDAPHTSKEG